MRKPLIISSILAFALQGVAHATYPGDAEASWDLPASRSHVAHAETVTRQEAPLPAGPIQAYAGLRGADLERAFCICDYAASTHGVSATRVEVCGAVYEELKSTKFHGDFNHLLLWWKENKPAEHQKIARADRDGAIEPMDPR